MSKGRFNNPECKYCDAAWSVERIGEKWSCTCCGKSWPVEPQKRKHDPDRDGDPATGLIDEP